MQTRSPNSSKHLDLLPSWLAWFLAILLFVTAFFWLSHSLQETSLHYVYKRDFATVYVGARAVAQGRGSQLLNLDAQRELMTAAISPYHRQNLLPYIYPLYVAVLFSPLGKMSLVQAFFLWTAINFLLTGWIAFRLLGFISGSSAQRLAILIAFFAWVPLQLTLSHGQLGLPCALGFTEAFVSLRARRQWQAGLWLALCLLKPQLLVFPLLALLFWQCWRAVISFATVLLIVLAISFAMLGFWLADYWRFMLAFNQKGEELSLYPVAMQNWRGLVRVLFGNEASFAAHSLLAALTVGSLVVAVVIFDRHPDRESGPSHASLPRNWQACFAIAILLGALSAPYLYLHDWIVTVPALVVLFVAARDRCSRQPGPAERSCRTLLWLIALSPFICFAAQFGGWPQSSRIQLVPWYMAALVACAIFALRKAGDSFQDSTP